MFSPDIRHGEMNAKAQRHFRCTASIGENRYGTRYTSINATLMVFRKINEGVKKVSKAIETKVASEVFDQINFVVNLPRRQQSIAPKSKAHTIKEITLAADG
jgi:hypothetical protein